MTQRNHKSINHQYLDLIDEVLINGTNTSDRTGTGTRSVFAPRTRIEWYSFGAASDYAAPVVTLKHLNVKSVFKELAWFILGHTNIKTLGCKIWDAWAREDGECGPIYGAQWRGIAGGPDQLRNVLQGLRKNPNTRQAIVSSWNPTDLPAMALPPCHTLFQLRIVEPPGAPAPRLDLQLYQRSADVGLGVPFNILSYYVLQALCASYLGVTPGKLTIVYGDLHIYNNHIGPLKELRENSQDKVAEQFREEPSFIVSPGLDGFFTMAIDDLHGVPKTLESVIKFADLMEECLDDFQQGPKIKLDVAV